MQRSKMAPKKGFIPLMLLSLSALFFYFYYHSSLLLPTVPSASSRSLHHNRNHHTDLTPNPFNFTFTLKVLTFNRLPSLSRCLRSLSAARYGGDRVNLHVYVDHFPLSDFSVNQSAILDSKLENSRQILDFIDGFAWRFGQKVVHFRTANAGLQAQWLEAWWPSTDDEFAFVVEDDLEVSPLYYEFLRAVIVKYYYNTSNFSPFIYGASLQRPRFVPGKHGNKLQLDSGTQLFLYQLVGTWGQLLFPKPWKEFRMWYNTQKAKGIKPLLQGMVTTGWYKKMGERIWTPWFIKFIHSRGYFNIYTNFVHERALSVSHRDVGVNYGKTVGPDSHLVDESSIDFDLLQMQPLSNLKWYDFCFREVIPGRVVRSYDDFGHALLSLQKQGTIILVNLFRTSEKVTKNLLCHFERLNIQNYVLFGPNSNFLLDLARRGHLVIDVDQFLGSIRAYKAMGFGARSAEPIRENLVKAYVIEKSLESGYNSWLVDGNILLLSGDLLVDFISPSYDFYAGKTSELFFVRSSSSARKIWVDDFVLKVAEMAKSMTGREDSLSSFVHIAVKLLEEKRVEIKRVDDETFGVKIDVGNLSNISLGDKEKIVFWPSETAVNFIQKRLEELSMWIIDVDSSCTAVVCHKS